MLLSNLISPVTFLWHVIVERNTKRFSRRIRIGHSEKTRTKKLVNNESEGTFVCSVIGIYFGILPAVMENFHSAHQSATSPGNLGEEF